MAKLHSGAKEATLKSDLWFCKAAAQFTDDDGEKAMLAAARAAIKDGRRLRAAEKNIYGMLVLICCQL